MGAALATMWLWVGAAAGPLAYRVAPVWAELGVHAPERTDLVDSRLVVARGERESFFLVLLPRGPRIELEVSVGALVSGRDVIGPEHVRVFRAHYVDARGVGPLADALVPLEAGPPGDRYHPEARPVPLLLALEIPAGTRAGEYRGRLSARIGAEQVEVPLTVEVVDVTLPRLASGAADAVAMDVELGAERAQLRALGWLGAGERALAPAPGVERALRWDAARASLWYPAGLDAPDGTWLESARLQLVRDGLEDAALLAAAEARGLAVAGRWRRQFAAEPGGYCADPVAYEHAKRQLLHALAADGDALRDAPPSRETVIRGAGRRAASRREIR